MTFGVERLEWRSYPMVKKIEDMFTCFDRLNERDGQTDRRTDTARRHRPRLCIASRGNDCAFLCKTRACHWCCRETVV